MFSMYLEGPSLGVSDPPVGATGQMSLPLHEMLAGQETNCDTKNIVTRY